MAPIKHGETAHNGFSTEYVIWVSMKQRCTNPNAGTWRHYGGRGISVCPRWLVGENGKHPFACFLEDMGRRPADELSLDRVDNEGNYEPGNCRWATLSEQRRNQRKRPRRKPRLTYYEQYLAREAARKAERRKRRGRR